MKCKQGNNYSSSKHVLHHLHTLPHINITITSITHKKGVGNFTSAISTHFFFVTTVCLCCIMLGVYLNLHCSSGKHNTLPFVSIWFGFDLFRSISYQPDHTLYVRNDLRSSCQSGHTVYVKNDLPSSCQSGHTVYFKNDLPSSCQSGHTVYLKNDIL